jgi:hypothetical protein
MSIESDIDDGLLTAVIDVGVSLALPLSMPDTPFDPANYQEYLEALIFTNKTANPTWGEDANHIGILQINYVTKQQIGVVIPKQKAGAIVTAFHKNRIIFHGSAKIKIYQHPTALTPIIEPQQTTYPVSIPYMVIKTE